MPIKEGENSQRPPQVGPSGVNETEFRSMSELSRVGMAQVGARTGKFIRVNEKFCEWTGYLAQELTELMPADITYIEDRAFDNESHQCLLKGDIQQNDCEKRYRRKDGTIFRAHANATLLRDANGQPDRTMAVIQDITQRKISQQALEKSGQQFYQVMVNVAVPAILHADDGMVLLVNHMWTHITGYRIEDIPKLADWIQKACGEYPAHTKEQIEHFFNANIRQDNGEWTVTTATGEQRVWHFSSTPLSRDLSGRRLLISTAFDITAQKRAAQALIESQQFTRSIVDNLFTFVGELMPDGILIEANRAPLQAAGIAASDVLGTKFWDCHWGSYSTQMQAQVRNWCDQVANGDFIRSDVQARMAGELLFNDVSLQKGAEQKLIESEKRLRMATTAVSDVVWTNDSDGLMQGEQSGWGKFTGQSHEDYQGLEWSRAIHPDDVQRTIDDRTYALTAR